MEAVEPAAVASPMPCVLLARDDEVQANLLADLLRAKGYDVLLAPGGADGWHDLAERDFRTIILDRSCYAGNLPEQVRRLRAQSADDGYSYVIVVGADDGEMAESLAAGVDDFLLRPVDPELLLARLEVAARIGQMQGDVVQKNRALRETNRRLEQANQRMHRDLESAARVQRALLPAPDFAAPGTDVGWRLRPCTELGGDILNCLQLDEHHLAFYVVDVSGHGVSSAMLAVQVSRLMSPMMTQSRLLKQRLNREPWYRLVAPGDVLRRLNEMFQISLEHVQYMTIVYGLLELRSGRTQLAVGGHPKPVIVRADGSSSELDCAGQPVGLLERAAFGELELELKIGDRLWLFSDGVTETRNDDNLALEPERFRGWLEDSRHLPAQAAVDSVMLAVERWGRAGVPDDDRTLLAIERREPPR
jgi:sigma-B regulation protein RsbU (phosphoserine phosphatase)